MNKDKRSPTTTDIPRRGSCRAALLMVPALALVGCVSNQEQVDSMFSAISSAADAETRFGSVYQHADSDGNRTDGGIDIAERPADGSALDPGIDPSDPEFPELALHAEISLPMRAGMSEEPQPVGLLASLDALRPTRDIGPTQTRLLMASDPGTLQEHWLDRSDNSRDGDDDGDIDESYRAYVNVVEYFNPGDTMDAEPDWYAFGTWIYANGDWEVDDWAGNDLNYGFTGVFVDGPEFGLPDASDPDNVDAASYMIDDLEGVGVYRGDVRGMFALLHQHQLIEEWYSVSIGPFWADSEFYVDFTEQVVSGCISCSYGAQGIIGHRTERGDFIDADLSQPTSLPYRVLLREASFDPNDGTFSNGGVEIVSNEYVITAQEGGNWGGALSIVNADFTSEFGEQADLPRRVAATGGVRWSEQYGETAALTFSSVAVPHDYFNNVVPDL